MVFFYDFMTLHYFWYPWVLGSFTKDGGERQEICLRCRRRHRHTWGSPQIWNHFQCSTKHLRIHCLMKSFVKTSIIVILMFISNCQIFAGESERKKQIIVWDIAFWRFHGENCDATLWAHLCVPNIKWSPIDFPPTLHNTWPATQVPLFILWFFF